MSTTTASTVTFDVPAQTGITVSGVAQGPGFLQRVRVDVSKKSSVPPIDSSTFEGKGNSFLKITAGSGKGTNSITYGPFGDEVKLSLDFQHSKDGGKTWAPNEVKVQDFNIERYGKFSLVASEDGGDNRFNDAVVSVSQISVVPSNK